MPLLPASAPRLALALAFVGVLSTATVAAGAATRTGAARPAPSTTAPPTPATTAAPDVPADIATITTPATAAPRPTSPGTTKRAPATTPKVTQPASGQQAVAAFTAAIDRGDAPAAWRLLAPRSQAFWRTEARYAATMDKQQQGGWAGWTSTRDRTARSVVITSSGDGEILVVTLRGTTSQAGQAMTRAQAFPVRHVKGTFRLELWDFGGGDTVPEVTAPGPVNAATVRTSDRTPTFQARAAGEEVAWALDDRDATFTNVSGSVAGYQPERPLSPGTHVLTLASVGPGWLTATAVVVLII